MAGNQTMQKTTFCIIKGHILQCKKRLLQRKRLIFAAQTNVFQAENNKNMHEQAG